MDHFARRFVGVMAEMKPWEQIEALYDERMHWSDRKLMAELKRLDVLPDENDPEWERDETWQKAYLYEAHARLAAFRRLIEAIPLLFERASYGDPGELMRGLRHRMEAIVNPNWPVLTRLSMKAAGYPQKGARLWAIIQLGILRDVTAFDTLVKALSDDAELVRDEACWALEMLCQTNRACRAPAIAALQSYGERSGGADERDDLARTIDSIKKMK